MSLWGSWKLAHILIYFPVVSDGKPWRLRVILGQHPDLDALVPLQALNFSPYAFFLGSRNQIDMDLSDLKKILRIQGI